GTLTVFTGSVDIAGTNQGLAMIAASEYGVDISKVKIVTGDTDSSPWTGLSAGLEDDLLGRDGGAGSGEGRPPEDASSGCRRTRSGDRRPGYRRRPCDRAGRAGQVDDAPGDRQKDDGDLVAARPDHRTRG